MKTERQTLAHIPTGGKRNLFCTGILSAVLLLGGCSQGDTLVPVEATLHIGGAALGVETSVTRAGGPKELTNDTDAIGVFLKGDANYTSFANRKYTYGTPYWQSESGVQLVLGKKTAELSAYYPYTEAGSASVTLTSQAYAADKEFYYLPFKASYMTSSVTLNLRRAYGLIRFSFIKGEKDKPKVGDAAYGGPASITDFKFKAALRESGTLDLYDGTVSGSVAPKEFAITDAFTPGGSSTPVSKDYLIVPAPFSGYLEFSAVVDTKEMKGKISAADLCGTVRQAFVEGTMYEIKVYVRPTGLEVKTFKVEDWEVTDLPGDLENK